jgi:hypothetical protein
MNKLYSIFSIVLIAGLMVFYGLAQDKGAAVRKNTPSYKQPYHSHYILKQDKWGNGKESEHSFKTPLQSNYMLRPKKSLNQREDSRAFRESLRSNYNLAQDKRIIERKNTHSFKESYRTTLDGIGNGMSSGKIASFSNLFSSQIYLNLSNGVSAYYSSNQAYYVIQDFLRTHQAISLNINDVQEDEENVYATGTYNFLVNGRREFSQIYISLKHCTNKWQITQITIN